MEVVFSITQEADGGYVESLGYDIVTEAVSAYFFDQPKPTSIRLHLVPR